MPRNIPRVGPRAPFPRARTSLAISPPAPAILPADTPNASGTRSERSDGSAHPLPIAGLDSSRAGPLTRRAGRVASDVPGLRDSVRNPHTGFLVPFGNEKAFSEKLALLINDGKLRQKMSREARSWAVQFSWEYSAFHFYSLMNADIQTGKTRAIPAIQRLRPQGVSYGEASKYEK